MFTNTALCLIIGILNFSYYQLYLTIEYVTKLKAVCLNKCKKHKT